MTTPSIGNYFYQMMCGLWQQNGADDGDAMTMSFSRNLRVKADRLFNSEYDKNKNLLSVKSLNHWPEKRRFGL